MDASQLPNVDDLLVTTDNPACTDLEGMYHARCAALQKYLVKYAWLAGGRDLTRLYENNNWYTAYGAKADALRPRREPSLAAFLADVTIPPSNAQEPARSFLWTSELSESSGIFYDGTRHELAVADPNLQGYGVEKLAVNNPK
ncbi:hypothetical protein JX265_002621 [Neoarthrinium moseri]|uniref:Uncharacterized protein n=1 Tax=Neoarthrinium moseri TaxID=1658444 RepID=A0A9P9WUS8_9PEZI|nr:hypothetical protein JX266_011018 [Neoarthrinium moseri]KAI1879667.1 hypothetical protein JX265_002621 [Neoarthrinium moseri]